MQRGMNNLFNFLMHSMSRTASKSAECLHIRSDGLGRVAQLGEHRHLFTANIYRLSIIIRPSFPLASMHLNPFSQY